MTIEQSSGSGYGFDHYRENYSHEELWDQLMSANSEAIAHTGLMWRRAGEGIEGFANELNQNMATLREFWTGTASDSFAEAMLEFYDYLGRKARYFKGVETDKFDRIQSAITEAHSKAKEQGDYGEFSLNPAYNLGFHDFCTGVYGDDYQKKKQFKESKALGEWEAYKSDRHDRVAQIVADLGSVYAEYKFTISQERVEDDVKPTGLASRNPYERPGSGLVTDDRRPNQETNRDEPVQSDETPTADSSQTDDRNDEDDDMPQAWDFTTYDDLDTDPSAGLASATPAPPKMGLFGNIVTPNPAGGAPTIPGPVEGSFATGNTATNNLRPSVGTQAGGQGQPGGRNPQAAARNDRNAGPSRNSSQAAPSRSAPASGRRPHTDPEDEDGEQKKRRRMFEDQFSFGVYLDPEEYDD
ncbi:WXG100 family type VII secretion target [Salininema proteolyticum]|uniref:WXG100 family type VII secretion target n=1 Tax=Salininema proteolyticum TaxID=1607685 RepID=A0ABV8U458_9ACTN